MDYKIFSNGAELTDAQLDSLPIDVMTDWLDMWHAATREDEDRFNAYASEREVEREIDQDYCI